MNRFIGNIDAKTDAKGRVFIPSNFRKLLDKNEEEQLVMRKDTYQQCLILYPLSEWDKELTDLRSRLNKYDEEQQQLYRQFLLDSEMVSIDKNGRILIPKRYLQLAGINSEVRFVGVDYTIEVWSKEKLNESMLAKEAFKDSVRKHLT